MTKSNQVKTRRIELAVGAFILLGLAAFLALVFKVADFSFGDNQDSYQLTAKFDNIGGLKVKSAVKIGGVVVGRVSSISLDPEDLVPVVEMTMFRRYGYYPETSSASIMTSGLLGEQYVGLAPGFMDEDLGIELLEDGGRIEDTKPALVLEDLIGQFLYSQDGS